MKSAREWANDRQLAYDVAFGNIIPVAEARVLEKIRIAIEKVEKRAASIARSIDEAGGRTTDKEKEDE